MLNFKDLKTLSFMDDLIYQNDDCYHIPFSDIKEIQTNLISESFKYHFQNCISYRNYCETLGVRPEDIKTYDDLSKIPLVPSILFKEHDILSCNMSNIVKACISSGTKGSISKIFRDETTLNRFLGSIQSCLDQIFNLDDVFCIHLGPSTEEAGDLWFSYAISLVDLVYPTENFVVNNTFYPKQAYEKILEVKDKYENIMIIGAPIMFLEFITYLMENNIKLENCESFLFITAGGWKRFSGKEIQKEEFRSMIRECFGNTNDKYYRDVLNMVELNTVLPECEYHVKHLPPWVKVFIIDPATMKPVNDGEHGIIAFLDPSSTSYPCFILSDDVGRIVFTGECKCGRSGQGIEILRRIKSVEARGCALKIDKKYSNT